jgi:hypothetical protein
MEGEGAGVATTSLSVVKIRLEHLSRVLSTEAEVLDRAFAVPVGTRELYDTVRDPNKTAELYSSLNCSNIRITAWQSLGGVESAHFLDEEKSLAKLDRSSKFDVFERLLQRYRTDPSGTTYLVSSREYLCLLHPSKSAPKSHSEWQVPRLFVLLRISQCPEQPYGDIMQLHEYITFYRTGRTVDGELSGAARERALAEDKASFGRSVLNYRPSIEFDAGKKPVLHQLIKRIALPSMKQSFVDWIKALGPLAARFRRELMELALRRHEDSEDKRASALASVRAAAAGEDEDEEDEEDVRELGDKELDKLAGKPATPKAGTGGVPATVPSGGVPATVLSGGVPATVPTAAAGTPATAASDGMAAAAAAAGPVPQGAPAHPAKPKKEKRTAQQDLDELARLKRQFEDDKDLYARQIREKILESVELEQAQPSEAVAAVPSKQTKPSVTETEEGTFTAAMEEALDPAWILDDFPMQQGASRENCRMFVAHATDEDLADQFWAQTWVRDCSIVPGGYGKGIGGWLGSFVGTYEPDPLDRAPAGDPSPVPAPVEIPAKVTEVVTPPSVDTPAVSTPPAVSPAPTAEKPSPSPAEPPQTPASTPSRPRVTFQTVEWGRRRLMEGVMAVMQLAVGPTPTAKRPHAANGASGEESVFDIAPSAGEAEKEVEGESKAAPGDGHPDAAAVAVDATDAADVEVRPVEQPRPSVQFMLDLLSSGSDVLDVAPASADSPEPAEPEEDSDHKSASPVAEDDGYVTDGYATDAVVQSHRALPVESDPVKAFEPVEKAPPPPPPEPENWATDVDPTMLQQRGRTDCTPADTPCTVM